MAGVPATTGASAVSHSQQLVERRPAAAALVPFGGGRLARRQRRRQRRLAVAGLALSALFALTVMIGMPAAMAREAAVDEQAGAFGQPLDLGSVS